MLIFNNENIHLRALEPEDFLFLKHIENDDSLWHLSNTQVPFSNDILKNYILNGKRDIFEVKQLRLVICRNLDNKPVGFVDLYDFSPRHKRAGIGIIIDKPYQNNGYAKEAIKSVMNYGFTHLDLHQFFAYIELTNIESLNLFQSCGFVKTGEQKDWNYHHGQFHTLAIYQNIKHAN